MVETIAGNENGRTVLKKRSIKINVYIIGRNDPGEGSDRYKTIVGGISVETLTAIGINDAYEAPDQKKTTVGNDR